MLHPLDTPRKVKLPARAMASSMGHWLRAIAWHGIHPELRERYAEKVAKVPLTRVYYQTMDGWSCPIFYIPAKAGTPGEPVILSHSIGLGPNAFRMGSRASLASQLSQAGFSVYLMTFRGDRESIAPMGRTCQDVDAIWDQDVPAALDVVRQHSGFSNAHWLGHGLGGQIGLGWCCLNGGEGLASIVSLGSYVRFYKRRTEMRLLSAAMRILPSHRSVPMRSLSKWLTVLIDDEYRSGTASCASNTAGVTVRSALNLASENASVGVLRQVLKWLESGELTDRTGSISISSCVGQANIPILQITDTGGPQTVHGYNNLEEWGHPDASTLALDSEWEHLDLLLGHRAKKCVFQPVIAWLNTRRRLAW